MTANIQPKHKQRGITIIEVLIAMLILAIGLLGMASLQVRAVQDTTNSSFRSIAIYYANDMADRMRANKDAVAAGGYNVHTGGSDKSGTCLAVAGCDSANMALHDKWEWQQNIAAALPAGRGEISVATGVYTVEVFWTDRVSQSTAGGVNAGTDETSVSFVFEI